MFKIKKNLFIALLFDGKDYPLQDSSLESFFITTSQDSFLPTAQLVLYDQSKVFENLITLGDGLPFAFIAGSTEENYEVFRLRIFNFKQEKTPSYNKFIINAYLDYPDYFITSSNRPYTGNSFEALKELADDSGFFKFDIDPSNDFQTWHPANSRRCVFANSISDHGYSNENSFFRLGVDLDGTFRYKNLSVYDPKDTLNYISVVNNEPKENQLLAVSSSNLMESGFKNITGGYNTRLVKSNLIDENLYTSFDKTKIKQFTNLVQVNRDLYSNTARSNVKFSPTEVGNNHINFQQAKHQNARIAKFYSTGLDLLFLYKTPLTLFSGLFWKSLDPHGSSGSPSSDQQKNGFYVVTARTVQIKGGIYAEKVRAFTTGPNLDPENKGFLL